MQNNPPKSHKAIGNIIALKYEDIKFFSETFFNKKFFKGYEEIQANIQTIRDIIFRGSNEGKSDSFFSKTTGANKPMKKIITIPRDIAMDKILIRLKTKLNSICNFVERKL